LEARQQIRPRAAIGLVSTVMPSTGSGGTAPLTRPPPPLGGAPAAAAVADMADDVICFLAA
jgi:hypothetical protein